MNLKIINLIFVVLFSLNNIKAQENLDLLKRIKQLHRDNKPSENKAIFKSIKNDFQLNQEVHAEDMDLMLGQIALSYERKQQWLAFEKYIQKIKNPFNQTSYLNMAVYYLVEAKNYKKAEKLALKTIHLYETYKDNPTAKPKDIIQLDWDRFMKMAAYPYYETYAKVLFHTGQIDKALSFQKKAIAGQELENLMPTSIELYLELLIRTKQHELALKNLQKIISTGKSSLKMNELLHELALKLTGKSSEADLLIDSIQVANQLLYKQKLEKEMLKDVLAPNFNLADINGNVISLKDLSGKIVVLDFWATWCAPCIAAMPAMKKAEEKLKDVVFIYIATQETIANANQRIKDFIKTNKFPTNVIIDQPDAKNPKLFPIANAYQVKGIPAKMIIDKEGFLRFRTEGFNTDAALINELTAMVNLLNK